MQESASAKGDALQGQEPKYSTYPDTGCEYAPSCLDCPFPVCRHDLDSHATFLRLYVDKPPPRDQAILDARAQGKGAPEIAAAFGIGERTVYRVFKRWAS